MKVFKIDLVEAIERQQIRYYKDNKQLITEISDLQWPGFPHEITIKGKTETRLFKKIRKTTDREGETIAVIYRDGKGLQLDIIND